MRALGLISGGCDSWLAAEVLRGAGLEVEGIHLDHGFVLDRREAGVRRTDSFPVDVVRVAEEFLRGVFLRPRHGYGSARNPCIDCRIFMLRRAARIADERGIEIVFTGEVLGQSRMTERRDSLLRIEAESGLSGRLLRPLSALHLAPTRAEREGRIDRSILHGIHGRGRLRQAELAARLGVTPRGGSGSPCCLLADRGFASRLRDLMDHSGEEGPPLAAVGLLRHGRHYRLSHRAKAVVARDEAESRIFRSRYGDLPSCQAEDGRGPVVLVDGEPDGEVLDAAAALAVRFGAHRNESVAEVRWNGGNVGEILVLARPREAREWDPL